MLHSAYSFSLAFKDTLVSELLTRFADSKSTVIDPFCGTGTTLLESKMKGLTSVGIDANPICVDMSRAKTDWRLNISNVSGAATEIRRSAERQYRRLVTNRKHTDAAPAVLTSNAAFERSPVGRYLVSSGLIQRGWISPIPAVKTLLVAEGIWQLRRPERNFLLLSLFGLLVPDISNMSYGPEIYKKRTREDCDVFGLFASRVEENLAKLNVLRTTYSNTRTRVIWGDSTASGLNTLTGNCVDLAISSPPYLSDHDYSRITRLELVFGGYVSSRDDLRRIKKKLMRSSSKNVYSKDKLAVVVKRFRDVQEVVKVIEERAHGKRSGFARVYPKLVGEYFGGMYEHFRAIGRVLRPGGRLVYVIGDQSSFFATPIPTARITGQLAEGCGGGLTVEAMEPLKLMRGTKGKVKWTNNEWLLVVRKGFSKN